MAGHYHSQMSLHGDFTPEDIPQRVLDLAVKNNKIFVDVLSAGAMSDTSLTQQEAENTGLIKNHWNWRVLVDGEGGLVGQIQFGFNIKPAPSVPSD